MKQRTIYAVLAVFVIAFIVFLAAAVSDRIDQNGRRATECIRGGGTWAQTSRDSFICVVTP